MEGKWTLKGFDTFEGAWYPLEGEWDDEAGARAVASKQVEKLDVIQPASSSGGRGFGGIQDKVYVVRPDGTKYQVFS